MPFCSHPHFPGSPICKVLTFQKIPCNFLKGFWLVHKVTPISLSNYASDSALEWFSWIFLSILFSFWLPLYCSIPSHPSVFLVQVAPSFEHMSISSYLFLICPPHKHPSLKAPSSLHSLTTQGLPLHFVERPLIFSLVVFHVLFHSRWPDWEFGKYWDVTCPSLNSTKWALPSVSCGGNHWLTGS